MPRKIYNDPELHVGKISNTEWGIVIAAMAVIDLIQIGLDLAFQVGIVANRFIDVFVGLTWGFYLHFRGINMNTKRIMTILLTFGFEMVPDVDALPLWTLDAILMMGYVKVEEKSAIFNKAVNAFSAVSSKTSLGKKSLPPKIPPQVTNNTVDLR